MKIVVSYISSLYNYKETIDLINQTSADGIHVDLMDGNYVENKNFEIKELEKLFSNNLKPLDIHLMVDKPSKYLDDLYKLNPMALYIHPSTDDGIIYILNDINNHSILPGIAINPDENLADFEIYFPYTKRVLLMSVYPGKGGQSFLEDTQKRLQILRGYQKKYNFEIYIDGGINNSTIKEVKEANGVVSGSYICNFVDFESRILNLKREALEEK